MLPTSMLWFFLVCQFFSPVFYPGKTGRQFPPQDCLACCQALRYPLYGPVLTFLWTAGESCQPFNSYLQSGWVSPALKRIYESTSPRLSYLEAFHACAPRARRLFKPPSKAATRPTFAVLYYREATRHVENGPRLPLLSVSAPLTRHQQPARPHDDDRDDDLDE